MTNAINIEEWDREAKLFAIRGLKQIRAQRGHNLLLKLIIDDDPVVRGKTALAMKHGPDQLLSTAADRLLEQNQPNLSILALELLSMTDNLDYSDRVNSLLNDLDPRVIKSVIASLTNLHTQTIIPILDRIFEIYQPEYIEALTRLFIQKNDPALFRGLEKWLENSDSQEEQLNILRLAAGMPSEQIRSWCANQLEIESGRKVEFIRWLTNQEFSF